MSTLRFLLVAWVAVSMPASVLIGRVCGGGRP